MGHFTVQWHLLSAICSKEEKAWRAVEVIPDTHTINTEAEKRTLCVWLLFPLYPPALLCLPFSLRLSFRFSHILSSVSPNRSVSTRTVIASIQCLCRVYCSLVYLGDYVVKYTFLDRIRSENRLFKNFFRGSFDWRKTNKYSLGDGSSLTLKENMSVQRVKTVEHRHESTVETEGYDQKCEEIRKRAPFYKISVGINVRAPGAESKSPF